MCKKGIKKFSFFLKGCYKFIFRKHRRYTRISFIIYKGFKMDQYVFKLAAGLANLLDNLELYVCLEFSFDTFNWF